MAITMIRPRFWPYLASLLLSLGPRRGAAQQPFVQPDVWDVDAAEDHRIELALDWLEVEPGFGGPAYFTRALGGSLPGPTIKVSAGTTLKVKFRNRLTAQDGASSGAVNAVTDPDTANLHFHGAHVTSVLPGDDTTLAVPPGGSYDYAVPFIADHAPGIHWIHPHHHGSTTLHVGGGAACALIVKDPPGSLPPHIAEAEEAVLVVQDFDVLELLDHAMTADDTAFRASLMSILSSGTPGHSSQGYRFLLVNGVHRPTLTMTKGRWQRWRLVFAGWQTKALDLLPLTNGARCEFQLLAKDGVYLHNFPRPVDVLRVPPGGRADVMVRCHSVGTAAFVGLGSRAVLDVDVVAGTGEDDTAADAGGMLAPWAPPVRPGYLRDLTTTAPTPGCACATHFHNNRVSDDKFQSGNVFLHASYLGAVVERTVTMTSAHSYHQHVYPFQIMANAAAEDPTEPYFAVGDWHDTFIDWSNDVTFRYSPTVLAGKVMVHCHNTVHSDRGMMAQEYVRDMPFGECQCDVQGPLYGQGLVDVRMGSCQRRPPRCQAR